MPAVPSSLLEPIWVEFAAAVGTEERPEFDPSHPLGCHRRRIADRVVFEHLLNALVHGSGYERIATTACSDRTIRRRLAEWARAGVAQRVHALVLAAYDRMIGLDLADVAVDGCITTAPCGGEAAGPSPVNRRKGGLKRSVAGDGRGIPLGIVAAGANRHDSPLLRPTFEQAAAQLLQLRHGGACYPEQVTAHLDAGYDSSLTRDLLDELGLDAAIAHRGVPAPVQATRRWPIERTHSWMNDYGKIRRCTDRSAAVVEFYLYLTAALVTVRQLIQRARTHYRWPRRPTARRLK
jgi:Transposase DDE domain